MRYSFFKSAYFLLTLFLFLSISVFAQDKKIYAVKTSTPPIIDGILNDSVWNKAIPISNFLQQEPIAGKVPSQKTVVKILYDNENIYIGFMNYDTEPSKIVARALKLDGAWGADDNVSIIFDTFNDKRSGYWFGTNPLGMRDDALLNGSGNMMRGFNERWNGIWDVRSAIVDSGWSTELIFPFSTFKFYDKPVQVWGIEFQRTIARNGETIRWSTVSKDIRFYDLSKQGELLGIKKIKRGNPIYVKPFLSVGVENNSTETKTVNKPGLDVKYGITQALSLDVTFNTDFSQVESDRAVINLSRFQFFFPEQREFFLEGANIFSMSFGGRNNLFYSRNIGLSNGNEIPITAGLKLVGKAGNFDIGALNVQTSSKFGEPSTNYAVARVKYNIFNQSYIGGFVSNKVSSSSFNNVFGVDVLLKTSSFLKNKNLVFGVKVAKTNEKKVESNSWAARVFLSYPNDLINQFMSYSFIQKNFNPEIGFVSRTGIQSFQYDFNIRPRIDYHSIKKLEFSPINSRFELDKDNTLLSANLRFKPFGFSTIKGDRFSFDINRTFDFVENDFEVFDNNFIRKGKYWFTSYQFSLNTARTRQFFGMASYKAGDYYNGNIKSIRTSVTWSANSHLSISSDITRNDITLNNANFVTNEYGTRLTYDFSTKVNSSLFTQWNNQLNQLNMNYRVKWEPNVGSNFFFVINHLLSTKGKLRSKNLTVLAKIVWLITI